jgi:SWI/SNF-related matrix-associated actin-dependent regulator 1 of chromatin subfamily A
MTLFKHQIEGIKFLKGSNPLGQHSFILADEMGLGKTRQAIMAAKESGSTGTLIVCPASVKINWEREIKMVYPEDEIVIMSTGKMSRVVKINEVSITKNGSLEASGKRTEWFIINYDILEKKISEIELAMEQGFIDTLILDEAHYIKGDSLRSKAIIGGRKFKKSGEKASFKGLVKSMKRVIALTGTPIMNRPIELFNILKAIRHPLGTNKTEYAKQFCEMFWMYQLLNTRTKTRFTTTQQNYFNYYTTNLDIEIIRRWPVMNGATNLDELREELKGWMLRRKKKDVLDLPDKIISVREYELDKEWRKKYESAWDDYLYFREMNPIEDWNKDNVLASRHLVEIGKTKQVCSLAKVKTIIEDIVSAVESEEKVIVFSQYTGTIMELKKELIEKKIGCRTLTGSDKMDARQKSIDDFENDDKIKVMILNIDAGGVGINLTAASIVMFADMDWVPGVHEQAEDRAHRIGQKGTVNVYYYVCLNTIEEDIVKLLNSKKGVVNAILEGNKRRIAKSSIGSEFLKLVSSRGQSN